MWRAESGELVSSLSGLRHVQTTITEGIVSIEAVFEIGTSISDALLDVDEAWTGFRCRSSSQSSSSPRSAQGDADDQVRSDLRRRRDPGLDEKAFVLVRRRYACEDTAAEFPASSAIERIGGVTREVQVAARPGPCSLRTGQRLPTCLARSDSIQQQRLGRTCSVWGCGSETDVDHRDRATGKRAVGAAASGVPMDNSCASNEVATVL